MERRRRVWRTAVTGKRMRTTMSETIAHQQL
jgi:hypothetical protein